MYEITDYTKSQAKKLGVDVKPSSNPKKKIDVFKNNLKIASVGGAGYKDYPNYIKSNGMVYANERRKLYKIRHAKDLKKEGTAGFYANKLLW